MKYKVVLWNIGGSSAVDSAGNFTFYTLNSAVDFCAQWVQIAAEYKAYLWDGNTWRTYE